MPLVYDIESPTDSCFHGNSSIQVIASEDRENYREYENEHHNEIESLQLSFLGFESSFMFLLAIFIAIIPINRYGLFAIIAMPMLGDSLYHLRHTKQRLYDIKKYLSN